MLRCSVTSLLLINLNGNSIRQCSLVISKLLLIFVIHLPICVTFLFNNLSCRLAFKKYIIPFACWFISSIFHSYVCPFIHLYFTSLRPLTSPSVLTSVHPGVHMCLFVHSFIHLCSHPGFSSSCSCPKLCMTSVACDFISVKLLGFFLFSIKFIYFQLLLIRIQ